MWIVLRCVYSEEMVIRCLLTMQQRAVDGKMANWRIAAQRKRRRMPFNLEITHMVLRPLIRIEDIMDKLAPDIGDA